MENQGSMILTTFLVLTCSTMAVGLYLIADYYMDEGFPSAFGEACNKAIQDDCLYINSHFSLFGVNNYDDDNECTIILDAGTQTGARYKLTWKRFQLEYSENCTNDYLAFYDSNLNGLSNVTENRYCGKDTPTLDFNFTQQYITVKFRSDSSDTAKGFRIMATRTLPAPCEDGYFLCESENRCIDGRLECDGTPQCEDRTDENDCNFWEKVIGGLLALGVAGMVGVLFIIVCGCTSVCVGYCICKRCCCRRRKRKVGDIKQSGKKSYKQKNKKKDKKRQNEADGDENQNEMSFIPRTIVAVPDATNQRTESTVRDPEIGQTNVHQDRETSFTDQSAGNTVVNGNTKKVQGNDYQSDKDQSTEGTAGNNDQLQEQITLYPCVVDQDQSNEGTVNRNDTLMGKTDHYRDRALPSTPGSTGRRQISFICVEEANGHDMPNVA